MSGKNKPPKFHHYVPKTYLKHWLDDSDLIYIYNKKTGTIKAISIDGQYFGKNNLNTITYPDNTKGYWVEKTYSDIEKLISPSLDKIASSHISNFSDVTHEDKLMLSLFVAIQFWRLPSSTDFVRSSIDSGDFASMALSVSDKKTGERIKKDDLTSFYEHISSTDLFQKAYPALRPLLDLTKEDTFSSLKSWVFYYREPRLNITSDNPILYITAPTPETILNDFILPISPGVMLISSGSELAELNPGLPNNLNILQICNANQFVVSSNKKYLTLLVDEYESKFKMIPLSEVENYIYKSLLNTKDTL
jgi:hypothetical protein